MEYRQLGSTELRVSAIGLGCSRLGGNLQSGSKKDAIAILDLAYEKGVNFFDTADSYGQGQSESLLGKAFKHKRDKVIFASKAGYYLSPLGSVTARFKPILKPLLNSLKPLKSSHDRSELVKQKTNSNYNYRAAFLRQSFDDKYLTNAVEGSLKRLQTDYLDIFQLHSPTTEILKTDVIWDTLMRLKKEGKIRYYGVSCDTVSDALICLEKPGISCIQLEINWLQQDSITKVLPLAKEVELGVIARQPFASGNLFNNPDLIQNKLTPENRNHHQFALQFVLQQPGIATVIPGCCNLQHLTTNLEALPLPN